MISYQDKLQKNEIELNLLNRKINKIGFLRLVCVALFLITGYYSIKFKASLFLILLFCLLVAFLILIQYHSTLSFQKQLKKTLINSYKNEIIFLKREQIPFENGVEFNNFKHQYANDLDIFGDNSLFQNLNRTATFIGKKTLANQLLKLLPTDEITKNQEAIAELSNKIDFRFEFLALASLSRDNKTIYENLLKWKQSAAKSFSATSLYLLYILPAFFWISNCLYFYTNQSVYLSITSIIFVLNLTYVGTFLKRIKLEINDAENIAHFTKQYVLLLEKIENQNFESAKLLELKKHLNFNSKNASLHLKKLSELFSKLDTISNFVVNLIFNSAFLYHIHVLKSLLNWKKKHATALEDWLITIGNFEMLNSFANFSYNNPTFVFPVLNNNYEISFENLSHPLLNPKTRIGNTVDFQPQSFIILSGSNMSGKSTFLRTLGVNMVLAGVGAPICASKANVHPLKVFASMRLSDSLSDNESYFYAEIKRLKLIMDNLENEKAFVLLDEILRGTNSDDKRNGTIEVIKKMIQKNAIGVIATHDIEVCLTTNDFPDQLKNNCFEVAIIENDLHFDYKLSSGICKNKSATFLMKKMKII